MTAARPTRGELFALLAVAVAAIGMQFLPFIPQPQAYHAFADQRSLFGIPNAADVLSNLAFVAAGALGLARLRRSSWPAQAAVRTGLMVFFAGILLTGAGSAFYHWSPSDLRLAADRLPMTIAFAGAGGAMFAERVSARSGRAICILMLVAGPASVAYWLVSSDVAPYALVQFGGMLGLVLLWLASRRELDVLPWGTLLVWYVLAKLFEAGDRVIWEATGGVFAGHALKHLAAAAGGYAIARALHVQGKP